MRIRQETEGNPTDNRRRRSPGRLKSLILSEHTLTVGFVGCLVVGLVLSTVSLLFRLTNPAIFLPLFFSGVLLIIISVVFGVAIIMAMIVGSIANQSRLRSQRAKHRRDSLRRYRDLQRQRRNASQSGRTSSIPNDKESIENDEEENDFDQTLPKWLIPLLKNRPAALAIHDDLIATSSTSDEIESKIQSRIDELGTEKVIIPYEESETVDLKESSKIVAMDASAKTLPTPLLEVEIEREALLNLLGALELQHSENRIAPGFYKRKRKQLRKRLSEISSKIS